MFEQSTVIRLFSILSYVGFGISAITGFIQLKTDFNLCMLMTSSVVIISAIPISFLDIKNQFVWSDKQTYYIRSVLLLIYSLLSFGLTHVGIGFGIFGIVMFVTNLISGVFETEIHYTISKNDMESPTTNSNTIPTIQSNQTIYPDDSLTQSLEETY